MPAIQRYKIHPQRDIIHEVTGLNGVGSWRSQNSMADYSTTTAPILRVALAIFYSMVDYSTTARRILIMFVRDCWARRQPPNGIRYVSVASKPRKSLSLVEGILGIMLAIFYSMADYSTTAGRILLPFTGGCWTRRQLRGGIGYVSVASILRKSLTLVGVVFIGTLAIPELDG